METEVIQISDEEIRINFNEVKKIIFNEHEVFNVMLNDEWVWSKELISD